MITVGLCTTGSMEEQKWLEQSKIHHLTVDTLRQMKEGDVYKFLIMDRNLEDITNEINEEGAVVSPKVFFRDNWAIYKHEKETCGTITWSFGESRPFEFDIEYDTDYWYPLENGHLPKEDLDELIGFGDKGGLHWTKFDDTARVGWRGPMMLWDSLSEMPDIFWKEDESL